MKIILTDLLLLLATGIVILVLIAALMSTGNVAKTPSAYATASASSPLGTMHQHFVAPDAF